jgi:hypothetical protein
MNAPLPERNAEWTLASSWIEHVFVDLSPRLSRASSKSPNFVRGDPETDGGAIRAEKLENASQEGPVAMSADLTQGRQNEQASQAKTEVRIRGSPHGHPG